MGSQDKRDDVCILFGAAANESEMKFMTGGMRVTRGRHGVNKGQS